MMVQTDGWVPNGKIEEGWSPTCNIGAIRDHSDFSVLRGSHVL